jgi:hypothetical protein
LRCSNGTRYSRAGATIFTARFTSVLLFSTVIVAAVNLLPSLLAPMEFGGGWRVDSSYRRHAAAVAASSALACVFVFFAILALQGALLNLFPANLFVRTSLTCKGCWPACFY